MDPVTNYCESVLGDDKKAKSALKLIPEFSDCSDTLLDMVFAYSKPVNLKPGEVLIQEGLFDQWVYFIIKGDLAVMISGRNLGSTKGPIVGERCILGEPRGANLVAGNSGLLALGVEMTIIDQLNRVVNDFRKKAKTDEEMQHYSEEKMAVSLELLIIILLEVVSRIIYMHRKGEQTFDELKKARPALNVQLQSLYTFAENSSGASPAGIDGKIDSKPARNISVYNFNDFADIVYFELLQKHLTKFGYGIFSHKRWKEVFAVDDHHAATIRNAYQWLKQEFGLTNSDLIEVSYSIFEVASKYTAAANNSITCILSISDCEDEKRKVMAEASLYERLVDVASQELILERLFIPIEQKLKSLQQSDIKKEPGKMSQSDIDALFG
jgi:hypothetical protein